MGYSSNLDESLKMSQWINHMQRDKINNSQYFQVGWHEIERQVRYNKK